MIDPNDITIIIPTYNRPQMVERAIASAKAQTQKARIMVVNDGKPINQPRGCCFYPTGRADHLYLTVYDAVHRANTPLVAILLDDDWYEPTFLERCVEMLDAETAYVFTQATIRFADGTSRHNWVMWGETRHIPSKEVGDGLLATTGIITPACCLYRRADVLRDLCPGNVPGFEPAELCTAAPSGPDNLLSMLPLLRYPKVGWIADSLVNLDGGEQSTTIREMTGDDRGAALKHNYDNARTLFRLLRDAQ